MLKPIIISLSPNSSSDDVWLSLSKLLMPFNWKVGKSIKSLESFFKKYFQTEYVTSYNSGRSALLIGLQALNLASGSEVLLQAFSCVVVANCIIKAGLKPVFVDINSDNFSLNINDLQKKITSRTKAVIVQNIFGIPDNLGKIKEICRQKKLLLIEDGAQALGAGFKNKKIGTFGVFSFFSFGRDKVVSSTFGGALVCYDQKLALRIEKINKGLEYPASFWIFKQLLHPVAFSLIVPFYFWPSWGKISLGKGLLFLLQKLRLLDFPVKEVEKQGKVAADYPKKMPAALASLAVNQLKKLTYFNIKRKEIAQYYISSFFNIKSIRLVKISKAYQPIFLRFPILIDNPQKLFNYCYTQNIFLGNWYDSVVAPKGTNLSRVGYCLGSCPNAENAVGKVLNLPTYPKMTMADKNRVVKCITKFYAH